MKRTIGIVIGVALLGSLAYLGGKLAAQQAPPAGAPGTAGTPPAVTRIAVVNLYQVIRNYQKFKNYTADWQGVAMSYHKQLEQMNANVPIFQKEMGLPETPPARREELERQLRDTQRKIQDMREEATAKMQKLKYDGLVVIYKEIEQAVQYYARAKNLDLVLHTNEPAGADAYMPEWFQTKISNNACIPMYMHPDLDITAQITQMLNQRVQAAAPTPPQVQQPVQR